MKSTCTLRPPMPPLALMYFAAPRTESTADWNSPGANGLSTSATTAMRMVSAVTPTSVAFGASFDCALAATPPMVTMPAAIRTTIATMLTRFTGSPLLRNVATAYHIVTRS